MTKITYVDALDFAIDTIQSSASFRESDEEIVAKLEALKTSLVNRKEHKTPTKTQKENAGVMDTIVEILSVADAPMTVKELLANEALSGYTSQKISALLRNLKLAGKVDKEYDKKVAKFFVVTK